MKIIRLFLEYGEGPLWVYDEEDGTSDPCVPDEFLGNEELVNANDELGRKYASLFINDEHEFTYVGFKTKEESKAFADELRNFSDLVQSVLGDKYEIRDEIDYDYVESDPESLVNERKRAIASKRRLRRQFLQVEKKANEGDIESMKTLYYFLYNGVGTEVDKKEAISWLKKAAKTDEEAICVLGFCYYWGNGVRKNREIAFAHFLRSAKLGFPRAIAMVGDMFYYGEGVERDTVEAMRWFALGAEKNDEYCLYALGRGYEERALGEPDYLSALEHYFKLAASGSNESLFEIGRLYEKGWGVKKNYDRALFYYKLSARSNMAGLYGLGHAYMDGIGVKPDYEKGLSLLKRSAESGYYRATYFLGVYHKIGKGVEQNDKKAFKYFKMAHDQGSWGGDLELGLCYEQGRGCEKNLTKAFKLVKASADIDFPPAYLALGRYYHEGIGCEIDDKKAIEYLYKAVSRKVEGSYEYLSKLYEEHGEADKAKLINEQKARDARTEEYEGEFYQFSDPYAAFDLYRGLIESAVPWPYEVEEFPVEVSALLLGFIAARFPEEFSQSIIDHYEETHEPDGDFDTPDYRSERLDFYRGTIEVYEAFKFLLGDQAGDEENNYRIMSDAFREWMRSQIHPEDFEDEDIDDSGLNEYMGLVLNALTFLDEDLRDMERLSRNNMA